MTGFDILLLVLIFTFIYLGYRRGLIGESFDIITAVVTSVVGLLIYYPLGTLVNKWTEWGESTSYWIAAMLVCLPVAVALLVLGMHIDRVCRDDKKIPDTVLAWGGVIISVPKSLLCLWLALMLLKASPFYSETSREEFGDAPVISLVQKTGGTAGKAIFSIVAPAKARKQIGPFLDKGF